MKHFWILSKLVAKHYDAHDFCERNCYDLVTFQCIELHTWWPFLARLDNTEACGRKAFGAPELKPWLVTKTDGRMAFGVEKNTLWMTCFQSSHCHGSWFILVSVLLFLSFLLWIFFLLFLDVHWLLLWFWVVVHVVPSVSRTHWPSSSKVPATSRCYRIWRPNSVARGEWCHPLWMMNQSGAGLNLLLWKKKTRTPRSGCQGGRGEKVIVGRRNSCSNPNEYLHVIKFGKQCQG